MFTRHDYLNHKCTHRQFYAQFVNESVKHTVNGFFPNPLSINEALVKDEHLNTIPLKKWDVIGASIELPIKFSDVGDQRSLAGLVCIAKEAARQLVE